MCTSRLRSHDIAAEFVLQGQASAHTDKGHVTDLSVIAQEAVNIVGYDLWNALTVWLDECMTVVCWTDLKVGLTSQWILQLSLSCSSGFAILFLLPQMYILKCSAVPG